MQLYRYAIDTLSLANCQSRAMSYNGCACDILGLVSPPLEADGWLAVGRRPFERCLPPRDPLRVHPRRRDRAEHEATVSLSEWHIK